MDYWTTLSFTIQILLAMGLANDHDRNLGNGTEYIHLSHSVEILVPENLKGATYYDSNTILAYSQTLLTIIDLTNTSKTQYKYISADFNPRKLVNGFSDGQLLLLSHGKHCVRQLDFISRNLTLFSGSCEQPGLVNGNKDVSRYNQPMDLQRVGEMFYLADYYNDCVRKLYSNGRAEKLVSLHSRPFEVAGNLFVAASYQVYNVHVNINTYARFVRDVNTTVLESCSPDTLSMLTSDRCLKLLPLSSEISTYSRTINSSFDDLICESGSTMAVKFTPASKPNSIIMQLYKVRTPAATGQSSGSTTPTSPAVSDLSTTPVGKPEIMATHQTNTTEFIPEMSSSDPTSFSLSTEEYIASPARPLLNHAHKPFDHLPKSYSQSNGSWPVILPVVLSAVTILTVLIVLVIIIKRRARRRQCNGGMIELEDDDASDDLIDESEPGRCLVQTDSNLACRFFNPHHLHQDSIKPINSNGKPFTEMSQGKTDPAII